VILDGYPAVGRRDGAGSSPPDEPTHLLRLLASLGIAHEADGAMTWEEFTAIASRDGSPLAGMPAEAIATLSAVFARNNQIAGTITGRRHSGDLLLFTAGQHRPAGTPGAQAWVPFVEGDVTVREIVCEHGAMLQPQALAEIGPLVNGWLTAGAQATAG
jgi:thioesterase domain-containing protein